MTYLEGIFCSRGFVLHTPYVSQSNNLEAAFRAIRIKQLHSLALVMEAIAEQHVFWFIPLQEECT